MELVTAIAATPGRPDPRDTDSVDPGTQVVVVPHLGLLAVADAVPQGQDGRAGARLVLELVRAHLERSADDLARFRRHPTPELRAAVLERVNEAFARAAQESFAFARRRRGLRLTLDVVLLLETEAFVGHVGDGRVYLVRGGVVHQLTVDASRRGTDIAPLDGAPSELADATPAGVGAGVLAERSFGASPQIAVESLCVELTAEDRFVVCGSAVHRAVPDAVLHTRFTNEHLSALPGAMVADAGGAAVLAACAQIGSGEPSGADSARARLAILAPMQLFTHCTERELRVVAQATHPRRLPADTVVFEEGQPGTDLYLVISGRVDVLKGGRTLAELLPGSVFGEMALLDEPNRSATARTAVDTELMVITRSAFFQMLRAHPPLAVKILWNLNLRLSASLRSTSARVAQLEG